MYGVGVQHRTHRSSGCRPATAIPRTRRNRETVICTGMTVVHHQNKKLRKIVKQETVKRDWKRGLAVTRSELHRKLQLILIININY